jgi:hypothetical protein
MEHEQCLCNCFRASGHVNAIDREWFCVNLCFVCNGEGRCMQVRWRVMGQLFAGKHAAVMAAQRAVSICLATLLSVPAVAGEDAAQAVQEGDVKQWMEYYERERRQDDERDAGWDAAPEQGRSSVNGETQPSDDRPSGASASRPDK